MNTLRIVTSGIIVWMLIFLSFMIMGTLPLLKESEDFQNIVILFLMAPIVLVGARFFYKGTRSLHGLKLGLCIITICLFLDATVTVPFVIIPAGGSYASFFINPGIAVMGSIILGVTYFYWKSIRYIERQENNRSVF